MKNTKCRLSNLIFDDFSATNSKKFAYYKENTSQKNIYALVGYWSKLLKHLKANKMGLYIVNHSKNGRWRYRCWEFFRRKNSKANAVESTRNSMPWINVFLVEANQNSFHIQNIFTMLQELNKMLPRQAGWKLIVRKE